MLHCLGFIDIQLNMSASSSVTAITQSVANGVCSFGCSKRGIML